MSRSRRKNEYVTEGQDSPGERKWRRRRANKSVRKADELSDGANYKRVFNSWDIIDFKFKDPRARRK